MTTRNLGIVSIATNRYLQYWKEQVTSLERYIDDYAKVSVFIFTDQVEEALAFSKSLSRISVVVISIPSYVWPDATLLRYRIMNSNFSLFNDQDVLVYLDADMRVVSPLSTETFFADLNKGVTLVRHPGFFREAGISKALMYFQNPQIFIRDLLVTVRIGGLGSWETNPQSEAYVTRAARKNYYCGGIWWGKREHFENLVANLSLRVDKDSSKGIVAQWHDESHLNQWASEHDFSQMLPSVCFVESYPWLRKIKPLIVAVEKTDVSR